MHCHAPTLTILPARRDLLKAASLLAGSAVFGSLDGLSCGEAADQASQPSGRAATPITIRGHHLFDMLDALGQGKSTHKTLGPVALKIRANPKTSIKVVVGVDDICGPCEWWDHKKSLCKKGLTEHPKDNEDSIACDKNAIRVLGLKPGAQAPADELYRLILAKIDTKTFAEQVCAPCRLVNQCKKTYQPKIEAAVKALSPS